MKDTIENYYKNLLIGAEDWAIQHVETEITCLERENAALREQVEELAEVKKAFSPTFVRELHAECLNLKRENDTLKAWKESALSLNAEMDEQSLAKMLGGELGKSCRKIIAEKVPMLVEENAALKDALRDIATTAHCIALAGPLNTPTLQDAWSKFTKIDSMASNALSKNK